MFNTATHLYLLGWLCASGVLFVVPLLGLGENAAAYYSNLLQIIATVISAILCWRTMTVFDRDDPMRSVWALIGAGVLSWGIGQTLYTGYMILHDGTETPYPWFSDIGFLLMQPLLVLALFVFAKAMDIKPPNWGIGLSLVVLIGALLVCFNASTISDLHDATTKMEYATIVAYALFDPILLATTVLSASLLTGGLLARPWWFCFGGLVLYFLSNRIYDIESAKDTFTSGSWVDLGWTLSFMLIGVAAMLAYNMLYGDDSDSKPPKMYFIVNLLRRR